MSTATFTDPNHYVWTAELDESTDPHQIDAGGEITVTAPSGESHAWSVNSVFAVTDPSDPGSALKAAFDQQGTQGYPVTGPEQEFINQCDAVIDHLTDMLHTANEVTADAAVIEAWVKKAAEVAVALAWIPIVGVAIAAVGAAVLAVELKAENCTDALVAVAGQAAEADLNLMDLRNKVQYHWDTVQNFSVMLHDAEATLHDTAQGAMNFWQALETAVKNCTGV
jgi:hypothetical protein